MKSINWFTTNCGKLSQLLKNAPQFIMNVLNLSINPIVKLNILNDYIKYWKWITNCLSMLTGTSHSQFQPLVREESGKCSLRHLGLADERFDTNRRCLLITSIFFLTRGIFNKFIFVSLEHLLDLFILLNFFCLICKIICFHIERIYRNLFYASYQEDFWSPCWNSSAVTACSQAGQKVHRAGWEGQLAANLPDLLFFSNHGFSALLSSFSHHQIQMYFQCECLGP